jgi:hypothetical protein
MFERILLAMDSFENALYATLVAAELARAMNLE